MWSCRRAWGQPLRQATWSGAGARAGEEAQELSHLDRERELEPQLSWGQGRTPASPLPGEEP